MITLSYQGGGDYNVYLGNKMVQLTQVELESICVSVLENSEINTEHIEANIRYKIRKEYSESFEVLSERLAALCDDFKEDELDA